MNPERIRPLALCVFRHNGRILVFEGHQRASDDVFYRPLGGGIDFAEYAQNALIREMREELGAEIANPRLLSVLENIFTVDGQTGHEVVFLFDAEFVDRSMYARDCMDVDDDPTGAQIVKALWKPLSDFGPGRPPLYPNGLLELLAAA